jgi:short chain dehydrogenase/Tripartite tricarboxylate transporter family receptor
MRLKDKIAIVVGAGQSPGEGMGNGRATVLRFAEEGAKVLAVDNDLPSAEETVVMARQTGGECAAFEADVTKEATLAAMVEVAHRRWGRIDILHYNVRFTWIFLHPGATIGIGGAGGGADVVGAYFQKSTSTRFQFVPYRGAAPIIQDLLAGNIDLTLTQVASALAQVRSGQLKAYVVMA